MHAYRLTNTYDARRKAREAHNRKMARRRVITAIVAGLVFVLGANALLAWKDVKMAPSAERLIRGEARQLDNQMVNQVYHVPEAK